MSELLVSTISPLLDLPSYVMPLPQSRHEWAYHWDGCNVPINASTNEAYLIGPAWPREIWVLNIDLGAVSRKYEVTENFQPLHIELANEGTHLAVAGRQENCQENLICFLLDLCTGVWRRWAGVPCCICDSTLAGEGITVCDNKFCCINYYHDSCCAKVFDGFVPPDVNHNESPASGTRIRYWLYRSTVSPSTALPILDYNYLPTGRPLHELVPKSAEERLLLLAVDLRQFADGYHFVLGLYECNVFTRRTTQLTELVLGDDIVFPGYPGDYDNWQHRFYFMEHMPTVALPGRLVVIFHYLDHLHVWSVDEHQASISYVGAVELREAELIIMCSFMVDDVWHLFVCQLLDDDQLIKELRIRLGERVPTLKQQAFDYVLREFTALIGLPRTTRDYMLKQLGMPMEYVRKLPSTE